MNFGAGLFTRRMTFLLLNQQYQSTERFIQGGAKKVERFIFIRYIVTSYAYAKLM